MLKHIVNKERRIEFCQEGLRWFDIKRLGLEVKHGDNILTANDSRKVIPIPYIANKALGIQVPADNSNGNGGRFKFDKTEKLTE